MANVAFKKGLLAKLPSTYSEGTFYVTTDERAIYLDVSDSARIRLGDFQEFETLSALRANTNPSTSALYYVTSLNVLAKWNGEEYVQINLDTGATSVEVVGDGNAVTAASYDPATRKLTLTMGETFATADELSAADEAIRGYVDEKTKGIASEGVVNDLSERMGVAEGEIDDLQEAIEGLGALATKDEVTKAELGSELKAEIEGKANTADLGALAGKSAVAEADLTSDLAGKINGKLDASVYNEYKTANDQAVAAAQKAGDDAQDAVDALSGKVGTVPADKTVVQMIADAQSAATYDDTALAARVEANEDAIDLLNDGAAVEGSVDYKIAQAVAAIMENPDDTMNSINELVTWCNDHAADALELSNQVSANKEDIEALDELVGGTAVATQITDAIAAALKIEGVDKYALASDLTAAIGRIAAMEAKVSKWDAAEQNAKDYADGLNTAMNGRVEALEAIDHEHGNKDVLDGITAAKVTAWDGAQAAAEATAAGALSAAKTELEGKISAAQTAAEKVANDNNAAMDTRVKVLEAIDHDAYVAADEQVLADAKAYANGLVLTWEDFN